MTIEKTMCDSVKKHAFKFRKFANAMLARHLQSKNALVAIISCMKDFALNESRNSWIGLALVFCFIWRSWWVWVQNFARVWTWCLIFSQGEHFKIIIIPIVSPICSVAIYLSERLIQLQKIRYFIYRHGRNGKRERSFSLF